MSQQKPGSRSVRDVCVRVRVFAAIVVFAIVGACSDWDAAIGVRCAEYPAYCRKPEANNTNNVQPGLDGGALVDGSSSTEAGAPNVNNTTKTISFRADIRPLMNRLETDPGGPGCSLCHYRNQGTQQGISEGQLDLTTLGTLRRGGKTSGPDRIIIPGKPAESVIVQKLRGTYTIGSRMPWNGPPYWSDAEIRRMETWIAEGATGTDDE